MSNKSSDQIEGMIPCPIHLITSAFTKWTQLLYRAPPQYNGGYWKLSEHVGMPLPDILLEDAVRVLVPYAELSLPLIDGPFLAPIQTLPETHKEYAGLFYTALLNTGKEERKLIIPKEVPPLCFWGYKLQKGYIDLYANSLYYVGYKAHGGSLNNYGMTLGEFCTLASGGEHINHGKVKHDFASLVTNGTYINKSDVQQFGQSASGGCLSNESMCMHFAYGAYGNVLCINRGDVQKTFATGGDSGIYVNHKSVQEHLGWQRRGGICIDRGSSKDVACDASGGVYILYESPQRVAYQARKEVCIITKSEQLMKDKSLADLVKKTEQKPDNIQINDIIKKIADHCKTAYRSQ